MTLKIGDVVHLDDGPYAKYTVTLVLRGKAWIRDASGRLFGPCDISDLRVLQKIPQEVERVSIKRGKVIFTRPRD